VARVVNAARPNASRWHICLQVVFGAPTGIEKWLETQ
jgi:hypothetical protein